MNLVKKLTARLHRHEKAAQKGTLNAQLIHYNTRRATHDERLTEALAEAKYHFEQRNREIEAQFAIEAVENSSQIDYINAELAELARKESR